MVLEPAKAARQPVAPGYAPGEHHFAYDYARVPESLARRWFTDEEMALALTTWRRRSRRRRLADHLAPVGARPGLGGPPW